MYDQLNWRAKARICRTSARLSIFITCAYFYVSSPAFAKLNFTQLQAELDQKTSTWKARYSEKNRARLEQLRKSPPDVLTALEQAAVTRGEQQSNHPSSSLALAMQPHSSQAFFSTKDSHEKSSRAALPSRFDWRNVNGYNFLQSLEMDQGECGSCVAFATVSALESALNIHCSTSQKNPTELVNLSRQYFFSCGGGNCDSGWKLSKAVDFLVQHGVPDQSCFPYTSANGNEVSCNQACTDASERIVHGFNYERPTKGWIDIMAIKRALLRAPLITSIILFEDLTFYESGVYKHQTGYQLGSHAITLVGWDDETRSWIAKNSWGTEWGDEGFFNIAWDDASLPGRYTWLFQFDSASQHYCQ